MSTLLASLIRNYFPKRPWVAPLHTLSKLYDVPVGFVTPPPPYFQTVYCFICGRRRVFVAGYRMICLVLAVTPTDRPKSVGSRCVIKVFGGVFYVVTLPFGLLCGCRGFCQRTESHLFLFCLSRKCSIVMQIDI